MDMAGGWGIPTPLKKMRLRKQWGWWHFQLFLEKSSSHGPITTNQPRLFFWIDLSGWEFSILRSEIYGLWTWRYPGDFAHVDSSDKGLLSGFENQFYGFYHALNINIYIPGFTLFEISFVLNWSSVDLPETSWSFNCSTAFLWQD